MLALFFVVLPGLLTLLCIARDRLGGLTKSKSFALFARMALSTSTGVVRALIIDGPLCLAGCVLGALVQRERLRLRGDPHANIER